ncbi:hypothetical protein SLEP1_g48911 [Rubroshorea leprosula]|uniref:Uncharacterized protein n=1 Tax=Rubroshorea leprosula TaxID=152421 RepID=A0AAV5LW92_9ROSI|nr:hypothetical protein SLEP1_g48911 [Rubroshorea leprosula]
MIANFNPFSSRTPVVSPGVTSFTLKAAADFFSSTLIPNFARSISRRKECRNMQIDNGEHALDLSHLDEEDVIISKGCIFRTPGMIKMQNEHAYTPYRFSFGPWHFGKAQLMSTAQEFKEAFLDGLIFCFPNSAAKMKELEEAIKEAHSKARECYEGEDVYELEGDQDIQEGVMDAAKENFEKILLLDGCFIIELFRKFAKGVAKREDESTLLKGVSESENTLVGLAIGFLGSAFSQDLSHQIPPELLSSGLKIVHLIDLARRCLGSSKGGKT